MIHDLKIDCPHCHERFSHEMKVTAMGDSPANSHTLHVRKLTGFRNLLTDEAKKVYDVKIPSTVIETVYCEKCDVEEYVTPEMSEKRRAASLKLLLGNEKEPSGWWAHEKCGDAAGSKMWLRVRLMQFLGAPVTASLAATMVMDGYLQAMLDRRVKVMAHVFNRGVAEGWIAYGVLTDAFCLEMAQLAPVQRLLPQVYVGTRTPPDVDGRVWLNEKLGADLFTMEGEVACEDPWHDYAKANGL